MRKPSAKQEALLARLRAGEDFLTAYQALGYSMYGSNPDQYLMRLLESGLIRITPVDPEN